MQFNIVHRTTYRYTVPVSLAHNQAHLRPRSTPWQTSLASHLAVDPVPASLSPWSDFFDNQTDYFTLEEPHKELTITATSIVELTPPTWPVAEQTPAWETVRDSVPTSRDELTLKALPFLFESPCIRRSTTAFDYAARSFTPHRPLLAATRDLTSRIYREFKYVPGATDAHTPTSEVFARRQGVCQDFAHLAITCLRSVGLAARYVSGYLLTDPPPGQPKLVGADASHAWFSVYCPELGWLDFDPTNDQMPTTRHVTVAWGRDYSDVCPVKGIFLGGGRHSVHVAVDVSLRGNRA